jgi:outer membrane protein assembly factor BamB
MRVSKQHRYQRSAGAALAMVTALVMAGPVSPAGASSPSIATSDTWPMFGHDPLHSGVSSDTEIGASAAASLAIRWSQPLGTSSDQPSPVVAYNVARKQTLAYYVTYTGVVSAFDALTGVLAWRRSLNTNVFSSPAVYGNTLYFGDNNGVLEALNAATGAVQCTFATPIVPPATQPGHIFSSPVVGNIDGTGPTVYFGDASDNNGGSMWAVTGVGNTAGGCHQKWTYDNWVKKGKHGAMTGVWAEPALAQESDGTWAVVFGTSNPDGGVYALNAASGSRLWHFQTLQIGKDEDVGAGPTISAPGGNGFADGVAYVDGKDGMEYALGLLSGQVIWSFTLGPGSPDSLGVSEAALTGNTLTVGFAGSVFALNATTGAQIWQATLGGTIQASPAVSGGSGNQALFAGSTNGHEYGLRLASGSTIFDVTTGGKIQNSTAIADGTLYFAGGGTLYAYAPASGKARL